MTTFKYPWGLERPREKRAALVGQKRAIPLQKMKLAADLWEALRRLDVREGELDAEIGMIDFVTPGGRFSIAKAKEWAAIKGVAEPPGLAKRGPGRPRKYKAGDPRPPRKSRAKSKAGLARHALRGVQIFKKN